MSLRELNIKVTLRDEASRPLRDIDKEVDKTKNGFEKMAQSVAALGFGAIMTGFAKSAVETYGKFEKYETVLRTTFTNSGEAAKAGMDVVKFSTMKATEAMEQIKTFAANTPYAVDELTGSFIKLANRGMTPSMETMQAFGDVAASQGKSFDQFTEAVLDATGGEFERMKEFGIKAHKMGNQVELSFKGVNQKIANTPEAIQAAIIGFGQLEGVMGGMDAVSNTFMGRINNMGDSFDAIKVKVGTFLAFVSAPLLNFYTDKSAGFDRLKFTLMALIPVIGFLTVSSFASLIKIGYESIKVIQLMGVSFMTWMGWAVAIGVAVTAIYLVLEDLFIFAKYGIDGSDTVFGKWLVSIGATKEQIENIRNSMKGFTDTLEKAWEKIKSFAASDTGAMFLKIVGGIAAVVLAISALPIIIPAAFAYLAVYIIAKWDSIINYITGKWNSFKNQIVTIWDNLISFISKSWNVFANIPIVNTIISIFTNIGKIIWNIGTIFFLIGQIIFNVLRFVGGLIYDYWFKPMFDIYVFIVKFIFSALLKLGSLIYEYCLKPIYDVFAFIVGVVFSVLLTLGSMIYDYLIVPFIQVGAVIAEYLIGKFLEFYNWFTGIFETVTATIVKVLKYIAELTGKPFNNTVSITENVQRNVSESKVPANAESTVNGISEFFGLEKRARGGPVAEGQSVIVGDGGEPEVFTAGASGFVTPVSKMNEGASSSGSKPITITLSFNGDMNFTGANGKENAMQFSEKLSEILDAMAPTLAAKMGVA